MPNAFAMKLSGYAVLSDADVAALVGATGPSRTVRGRYDLIREGDKPGPVLVVLDGWACRYKVLRDGERQITAFMLPGDFCDLHVAELDAMDHSIGAVSDCHVASIPRDAMDALLGVSPALTHALWRSQLVDEAVMRAWIVGIGRREGLERVAHLMLELYARMRAVGLAAEGGCAMPLTQAVLADALGLTPVHVNRVLRTLRERGVMELGSGTLSIVRPAELARIAGFDDNYLHKRMRAAA